MCNIIAIAAAVLVAESAVIASLVSIVIALPPSMSIFGAWGSIVPLTVASICLGAAFVALGVANNLLQACIGGRCTAQASAVRGPLMALMTIIGAQAIALAVGAAGGAIPFVGAAAGAAVLACLAAQAFFWSWFAGALDTLATCEATPAAPRSALTTVVFVIAILITVASVAAAGLFGGPAVPPIAGG